MKQKIGSESQTTLNLIKSLFQKTIKLMDEGKASVKDVKTVSSIVDWCITHWYNISERVRSDCAVFDIC